MYKYIIILVISIIVTFISFFMMIIWLGLYSTNIGLAKYYEDAKYQVITGEILDYTYGHTYISIELKDIDNEDFVENYFIIEGYNYDVLNNLLYDNISFGAAVEIIAAPGADEYTSEYQIVGLKIDGEVYLEFDIGKQNIIDWYEEEEVRAIRFRNIVLPIFIASALACLYSLVKLITYKKTRDINIYKY